MRLYEKRHEYTRTRMVQLAPYLVGGLGRELPRPTPSTETASRPSSIRRSSARASRSGSRSPPDLMELLRGWALGFCPLNSIERDVSDLIDARGVGTPWSAPPPSLTADDAIGDARAGRHPDRLHRQQVAAPRSPDAGRRRRGRRREHPQHPARVRARHHVPVRPDVRLQRVLQVLQEHRERALQVHPDGEPHALRRKRQPRHGHRQHLAPTTTRRCRPGSTATGCATTSPESLSRWTGSSTRSRRRRTARSSATSRSSGSRSTCIGPATRPAGSGSPRGRATTRSPPHPCSSPATRPSALRTSSRSRSASSARCTSQASSRSATCRCEDVLDRYELYIYKQWLRVYMRSKMIKHNKDLFETLDEPLALLEKLHIY